jgi:hypothetical protein
MEPNLKLIQFQFGMIILFKSDRVDGLCILMDDISFTLDSEGKHTFCLKCFRIARRVLLQILNYLNK